MSMKLVLLLILSVAIFCISFYLTKSLSRPSNHTSLKDVKMTTIRLKESVVNVGDIPLQSQRVRSTFTIYNTGPNDLVITDVRPDCKCTVGFTERERIIPVGDSTDIVLEYKPSYEGAFQVSATVELNVETTPLLIMRGNIIP